MSEPTYGPHNPHPLSQLRTELVWEGKYDEYGDRREVDIAECALPMQKIYERLNIKPQQLTEFCRKWNIAELAVFGSILRNDFRWDGDDPSDIDFLYVLPHNSTHSLFDVMAMREELEKICMRKVDLVSKATIQNSRNWLRRQDILGSGMILYAQR